MRMHDSHDSADQPGNLPGGWAAYCDLLENDLPCIERTLSEQAIRIVYASTDISRQTRLSSEPLKIFWCQSDEELGICMSWFMERSKFLRPRSKSMGGMHDACPWPRLERFARSLFSNSVNNHDNPLGRSIAGQLPQADQLVAWFPDVREQYESLVHATFDAQSLFEAESDSRCASLLENAARLDWLRKADAINLDLPGFDLELLHALGVIHKNCLLWLPFENASILLERPQIIRHAHKVIHADGAPAVVWRNGTCTWALNGVRVSREIVQTPASDLKADIILRINDADARREVVRKIGPERILAELGAKLLDCDNEYELYALDIGDGWQRPYLKMKNPSLGVYHVEGVHPDCRTVYEALAWRNATDEAPVMIS